MLLDVALTPVLLQKPQQTVCIVVDVLRASSSAVTMFDRGVEAILVAPEIEVARQLRAAAFAGALLCGEAGGLRPDGFDYGNSPVEFGRLDLRGRLAVLATSNGTRALHAVSAAPVVLIGCLLNRAAVCDAAIAAARQHSSTVTIVCAGNDLGTIVGLDDCFAAGALVETLRASMLAMAPEEPLALTDAAHLAWRLYRGYDGSSTTAFREAVHGCRLAEIGFSEDLTYCGQSNVSASVPRLSLDPAGRLLLRLDVRIV